MVVSLFIHIFLIHFMIERIIQKKFEFLYHYRHTFIFSLIKEECSLASLFLCQANFDVAWNKISLSFQTFQNENIKIFCCKQTLKQLI